VKACMTVFLLFSTATALAAPKQTVELDLIGDRRVEVKINGEHFATFNPNWNGKGPKPYFSPVKGPGGIVMTRKILKSRKEGDHVHHKGIWLAIDEVNGVKFWAEQGKIVTRKLETATAKGRTGPGIITVTNEWRNPSGKTEVTEQTRITIYPNRVIEYDITFKAGKEPVEFHDTKEGLFGFRMVDSMREREGGTVINSRGEKGTSKCWGKTADWIDYYGPVNGKTFGVAIFDHPKNFRKSRYHVRNYGLFSISPFGQKAYSKGKLPAQPYTIKPQGTLRLRYAMYIHAGSTKEANVGSIYQKWVKNTSK